MIKLGKKTTVILKITILAAITNTLAPVQRIAMAVPLPRDNPAAKYKLKWSDEIKWSNVASIAECQGETLEEHLRKVQAVLAAKGGGVVYFPAGVYKFKDSLYIKDGIVTRGADLVSVNDARDVRYRPPTQFEFPKYAPTFEGEGTPIDTAFKGIYLEDPEHASNCGVVNIAINRGHIDFQEGPDHKSGRNRLVHGCVLRNAAVADPKIPDKKGSQHPWQRFTQRHHAAIAIRASENILVANNRLPESGEDNFVMKGYILKDRTFDVVFDYDNRPGLYINDYGLGGSGGKGPDGTPQTHPWGFRKGIVIRDNYVFCTGRCAISFTGDGTICANNVIRFKDNIWRPTTTGANLTKGSSTNDNRAIQMRGWRWTVEGNDYIVYRNWAADRKYKINDGEGLMHEDHVNSSVLDSKLINNKGNSYISIYKTGGINGLLVKGNDIRTRGGISAIYVVANRNSGPYECKNVSIIGNTTSGSGIQIAGSPGENNIVRDNRHIGRDGRIINEANARCENNTGYEEAKN
ncbi:MAG: hypothetical protein KAY65_08825 [Planctomycetes bacterium]|nr:hypothetical protein [Planctomycetota bacterium]